MTVDDPVAGLFERLLGARPRLEELLDRSDRLSGREDSLGPTTETIVAELRALAPGRVLNRRFVEVIDRWAEGTEPARSADSVLVNAFLQARFFLQLAVHCARQELPRILETRELPGEVVTLLRLYEL
jgi:hypothetical protein